jgi:hypothetical protein
MFNKKYVALVLVVGLIVSVSIVLGQDKDEYAKELAAKEQNGLSTPIEKPSNQPGKVPMGGSPLSSEIATLGQKQQSFAGSANQTPVNDPLITHYFHNYIIKHYSGAGDVLASIKFLNGIATVGNMTFVKDGATLPVSHIDSDLESTQIIHIYYHYSRYNDIFALLEAGNGGNSLVYDTRDPSLSHIEFLSQYAP